VALDVARILSRKAEELAITDISTKAFKKLEKNKIENVKKNKNLNELFLLKFRYLLLREGDLLNLPLH